MRIQRSWRCETSTMCNYLCIVDMTTVTVEYARTCKTMCYFLFCDTFSFEVCVTSHGIYDNFNLILYSFFFGSLPRKIRRIRKYTKLMFDVFAVHNTYRWNSIIRHPSCWVRWILLTLQYEGKISSKFDYYISKTFYIIFDALKWKKKKMKK